jgi:DNA helicase-2/ATP-dependent DNA helicase PcrA
VGDDDQSIYRFRGAEVKNILKFPEYFDGADIIRLERNYRSTAPILRTAASVVDHNKGRLGKEIRAERGDGKTPVLAFPSDQDTEAEFCAELVSKSMKGAEGGRAEGARSSYSDWAVLYRTNAQSLSFETEFLHRRIPYRVVGSLKFYEREEVKDTLALLSFLVNPRDEIAFRRVVNKPSRGVGPATVERIVEKGQSEGRDGNLAIAAQSLAPALSAKAHSGITSFLKAIEAGRAAITDQAAEADSKRPPKKGDGLRAGVGLSACVVSLAVESGIAEHHLNYDELTGNQRLSNLQELANAASLYEASEAGLLEFLEHIELDRSIDEGFRNDGSGVDAVTLITLHNTKGLEFRRVIMTGVEQGIFPRDDKSGEELEEERRLFYVGATRAMDELYITSCNYRRMYGRTEHMEPSLFLREIDNKGLRVIGSAPYGFGSRTKGSSAGHREMKSSDGRWTLGDRVYNDDHGYGSIVKIKETEDGPVIKVIFETGYEKSFLSLYQSSSYTRIRED